MSKHTQEPWSFDKYENIIAKSEQLLLVGISTPIGTGLWREEGKANARRIVACVNALAGLTTEQIEDGAFAKMRDDRDFLLKQNSEMLSALDAAVECKMVPISSAKEGGAARHSIQVQVADQIRSVIAKAKGGAA